MLFEPMTRPWKPFHLLKHKRSHLVWHTRLSQTDQRYQRLLDRLRELQAVWWTLGLEELEVFPDDFQPRRAVSERVDVGRVFGFEGGSL